MVATHNSRQLESHRIALIVLVVLAPLLAAPYCSAAEATAVELPPAVAKKADMQSKSIDRLWNGAGHVVVGKLDIPKEVDNGQIASRTLLLKDGWFAARLYPGRTLTFRAHSFKSIDILPPEDAPKVFDAGTIKLEPIDKEQLTTVRGIAAFPKDAVGKRIHIELQIEQPPPIFADWAYEGGPMYPVVAQLYMPAGEEFHFKKLSDFDYRLRISAPHFIVQEVKLPADRSKDFDIGKKTLVASPKLVFSYVSQFDGTPPAETQKQTIECDDNNTFLMTKKRDDLGNQLFLRLHPDEHGVVARFWSFPNGFYDLGKTELKDEIANFSLERIQAMQREDRQLLEEGHVYYFECPEKKLNCLFSISADKPKSIAAL